MASVLGNRRIIAKEILQQHSTDTPNTHTARNSFINPSNAGFRIASPKILAPATRYPKRIIVFPHTLTQKHIDSHHSGHSTHLMWSRCLNTNECQFECIICFASDVDRFILSKCGLPISTKYFFVCEISQFSSFQASTGTRK